MQSIETKGLSDFQDLLKRTPVVATKAASLALNHGARQAVIRGKRGITSQVNLTQKYVGERLRVSRFASATDLSSSITGRTRPTSLRRFQARQLRRGGKPGGVSVRVKPGGSKKMRRAFFLKLKRGGASADGFNVGVAIRLRDGEHIEGKKEPFGDDKGLYLLYGPSVDQVWRDVRDDIRPGLERDMSTEFHRQFARLI